MLVSYQTMSEFDSQSKMILYLYNQSHQVKTVVVTKNSSISVLDLVCKSDKFIPSYIYNGRLLVRNMKFKEYEIQSDACIYVTNNISYYFSNKNVLDELMNKNNFINSNIQMNALRTADNSFRNEMDRLCDLHKIHIEKEMIRQANRKLRNETNIPIIKKEVQVSIPKSELSTQPLPKFW